jgi:large conductance mechanosensitive channel
MPNPCCIVPIRHWATVVRDFVTSGHLLDLAIALVIGNAFTKVIESLVDNILTPICGFLFDGIDIADWKGTLKSDRWPHKVPVILPYGKFLKQLIYFAVITIILSLLIMVINKIKQTRQRNQINPQETLTRQELILMEHTNLLKTIAQSLNK